MIKNLRFNQLKKVRFCTSSFLFISLLVYTLLPNNIPDTIALIIAIVAMTIAIIGDIISLWVDRNGDNCIEDELSKTNENKASKFTLKIISCILLLFLGITLFSEFSITVTYFLVLCIYIGIDALGNGYYLHLERSDAKNADFDNED